METQTSVDTGFSASEAASPVAADSSVSQPETPAVPAVEAAPSQPADATPAATVTPDEFPDDTAFEQLPGAERQSNWQKARARIGELNDQVRTLSERAAIAAQLEEMGGLEQLQRDAEMVRGLFTYKTDEYGNTLIDPQTGLPYITTAPFIQNLQQGSPDAFYTMLWEAVEQPVADGQSVGDWLLQHKYGLNPALIETYRQIQSPNDAVQYVSNAVTPDELTYIPAEFHEAYKSFDATDRQHLQDLSIDDEQRFLSRLRERKENIDNQKFIQEVRLQQEQAKLQQQQQWEMGIRNNAMQVISSTREQTISAQMERLKAFQPFGPEDVAGNQLVYDDILAYGEKILENPQIAQKAESAGNLYYQAEYYKATGNQMMASRARAEADKLTMDLQREYAKAATQRLNLWNERLKGRIVAAQPQTQPTPQVRPQSPTNVTSQPQPVRGSSGFGISEERKRAIAQQLALSRQGQA